jgi:uncharacterized membrane protein
MIFRACVDLIGSAFVQKKQKILTGKTKLAYRFKIDSKREILPAKPCWALGWSQVSCGEKSKARHSAVSGIMALPASILAGQEPSERPMHVSDDANSLSARALLAAIWGIVCAMILSAPILLSHSCIETGSGLYLCFSRFCHQIPERSFFILGYPLAVCHRCFGIYLGFFFGSFIDYPLFYRSPQARRIWVLAAGTPLLFDVLMTYAGLWRSTGIRRFATGLFLGCLISPLLVRGISEFLSTLRIRRLQFGTCKSREAFHE